MDLILLIMSPFIIAFIYYLYKNYPVWNHRIRGLILMIPMIGSGIEKFITAKSEAKKESEWKEMYQWIEGGTNDISKVLELFHKKDENYFKQLFKDIKAKIREDIDNFRYDAARESILRSKILLEQNNVSLHLQSELDALNGEIALKLDDKELAKKLKDKIILAKCSSEIIVDYLCLYASLTSEMTLFDEQISALRIFVSDEVSYYVKYSKYLYFQNKYDDVIITLCGNLDSNDLKNEFQENKIAAFYAGMAYLDKKLYFNAIHLLSKSTKPNRFSTNEFYLIKAKAYQLTDQIYSVFLLEPSEKEYLQGLLEELNTPLAKSFFEKMILKHTKEYWILKLHIALYICNGNAIKEYEQIPEELKHNYDFRILYADIKLMEGSYSQATQILTELYKSKKDPLLITRILTSYMGNSNYQDILKFADEIDNKYYNDINCSIIIEAFSRLHSIDETVAYSAKYLTIVDNPVHIYAILGNMNAAECRVEQATNFYEQMLSAIPLGNISQRKVIVNEIRRYEYYDIILRCLEPCLETDEEAQKMFVYDALHFNNDKYTKRAESIITNNLKRSPNDITWLRNKAHYEVQRGNFNTAKDTLEKIYNISPQIDIVYNLARLKLQLNDLHDIEKFAHVLTNSNDPAFIMLGATCYHEIKNYLKSEQYSLYAIALLGNQFNEILYMQYLRINLFLSCSEEEQAELDEVRSDCAIHLVNDTNNIWIGSTSDQSILIENNGNTIVDVCFHHCQDHEILPLLGLKIGDFVNYKGVSFKVHEIWAIKTKIVRHCLNYHKVFEKHGFLKQVTFSSEDFIDRMKPFFAQLELQERELLSDYNFRNRVGLPLNIFAGRADRTFSDVVINIWQKPNQAFYAGEISDTSIEGRKIVLSPTSIGVLHALNLLHPTCMIFGEDLIIANKTKLYYAKIFQDSIINEKQMAMAIHADNGQIYRTDYTKEMKDNRTDYYRSLFNIITNINENYIEVDGAEYDENSKVINMISIQEYESIKLAEKMNALYLTDDLFIRKYIKMRNSEVESITSISILNKLLQNDDKYLDILVTLSNVGYITCYDFKSLCLIYNKISSNAKVIGSGSKYHILIQIIKNSLSYVADYDTKIPTIIFFISYLYDNYCDKQSNYVIETITEYLYMLTDLEKLKLEPFIHEIARICDNNEKKIKYFENILKRCTNRYFELI